MNKTETFERFEKYLRLRKFSESTKKIYRKWAHRFWEYSEVKDSSEITTYMAQDYLDYLLSEYSYAARTYNQAVYALRALLEGTLMIGVTPKQLPKQKVPETPVEFFTGRQVRDLIDKCENQTLKAAIALGYACGLRVSEIVHLKFGAIHKGSQDIIIYNSKGDKTRVVGYSDSLAKRLNDYVFWLRDTYPNIGEAEHYLFPGVCPEKDCDKQKNLEYFLPSSALSKQFSEHIQGFDFVLPFHTFHSLRHAYATELSMRGVPLPAIQKSMGHTSAATTANYIHTPNDDMTIHVDLLDFDERKDDE